MAEGRVERRLAAILAADVAGYSRLMGADEVGTLRALQAHRGELIDPAIAAHRGRIVKTTGDGILVEFASVVDAVACAAALANLGRGEEARAVGHRLREIEPDLSVATAIRSARYANPDKNAELGDALRRAGLPE